MCVSMCALNICNSMRLQLRHNQYPQNQKNKTALQTMLTLKTIRQLKGT